MLSAGTAADLILSAQIAGQRYVYIERESTEPAILCFQLSNLFVCVHVDDTDDTRPPHGSDLIDGS